MRKINGFYSAETTGTTKRPQLTHVTEFMVPVPGTAKERQVKCRRNFGLSADCPSLRIRME
jgi:hypothetical protein